MLSQQSGSPEGSGIRLICIDIDGTLLDSRHRIPPRNREAIRRAAGQGVIICLMTARPPGATLPIQQELGITGPVACFGGGLLEYQGRRLWDRRVPAAAAELLLRECAARRLHLSVYRDSGWYLAREDRWSRQETAITGMVPVCAGLEELLRSWGEQGPHKLLCMGEPDRLDDLARDLEGQGLPVRLLHSKATYLEAVPEGTGKAEAMELLCGSLGIPLHRVMALGDHDQDVPMLRAAGFGVAMGNASPAAQQAAPYHTADNDRAGVAQAIDLALEGRLTQEVRQHE